MSVSLPAPHLILLLEITLAEREIELAQARGETLVEKLRQYLKASPEAVFDQRTRSFTEPVVAPADTEVV